MKQAIKDVLDLNQDIVLMTQEQFDAFLLEASPLLAKSIPKVTQFTVRGDGKTTLVKVQEPE